MRQDDLCLLPAIQVEPPCREPVPGVLPSLLGLAPEAVEGVSRMPAVGPVGLDGCRGVWGLARV